MLRPILNPDIPPQVPAKQRDTLIKLGFQGKAAIYLPETARFEHIANLPQSADVGGAIDQAIDTEYEVLRGALPRSYCCMTTSLASVSASLLSMEPMPLMRAANPSSCSKQLAARILASNKTRQGYARKRILKPAGFVTRKYTGSELF